MEVFAWTHEEMPRISLDDMLHQLNVDPAVKPIKQKRRNFTPKGNATIA